jgi:glycogen(starch) synthase
MRVLHLTRDFPPRSAGGISTAVGGLVRASLAAGIPCAVISFDGWRPRARAGATASAGAAGYAALAPVHEGGVDVLRAWAPAHVEAARAFALAHAPDVLHVHHDMLWPLATELRALLGCRAVLTVHVLQAEQDRLRGLAQGTLSSAAQARALAEADAVIAPSRAVGTRLADAVPDTRLAVVPLGLDDTTSARAAAAAPRSGTLVLYAGRFADINGTAELFAAIPRIAGRVPAARFAVGGGLPENRKAEARWLRRWHAQAPAGVQERVKFPGWLSPDALAALYAEAALLLAPSWFETFGLVVLEAMLHGVPVVATAAGALAERIAHERTGLLSAVRDVDALVDNAVRLLDDPALAARLGAAAAIEARRHGWNVALPALVQVYEQASQRHGRAR